MTKAELIQKVKDTKDLPDGMTKKSVATIVDALFAVLKVGIKKDKRFSYPGFGTFNVKTRKARKGRNPQTGKVIKIKASKTVTFKPSPAFKGKL